MSRVKIISLGVGIFFIFFFQTFPNSDRASAQAGTLDLTSSKLGQAEFKSLSKELGLAVSYLPVSPAEPLGIVGFDVGIEVTAVSTESDSFAKVGDPPKTLILPKLHLQKGLPLGIDIGAIYSKVSAIDASLVGGEIKYAIIAGNVALPAVAVRGAFTKLLGVDSLDLSTVSADLSVSKGFAFITPYAGAGLVKVTSKEKAGLLYTFRFNVGL
ncbi:MAG: hypothetical protein HY037_03480 [Nitrospirae bacterium]|nr:hypothetical protein [Candidatus Troglogloeales bacterium]